MADTTVTALTHARVLRIALPIVLANASIPILGAVDTGVVGQLGAAAPIGAVGLGATILATYYWLFGFLRMGITGMTAQALGRGERDEVPALLMRGLLIGGASGLAIIALQTLLFSLAFSVSPASDAVEDLTRRYMAIRVWGAPAIIAMYAVTGWLIAAERTRAVLISQLWMNGVNIGLDLFFVLGLGWGVGGVALATILAEWTGLALGLWFCRDAVAPRAGWDWARIFDRARLWAIARVNSDILLRTLCLQAMFTSFMMLASGQGDDQLASAQILMQFLMVAVFAMDGFAFAAQTLVGQAHGAGQPGVLKRAAWMCSQWGGGSAVAMALVFVLIGGWVIDLMTTAPEVRALARDTLPWMIAAPVVGVAAWMLDGIFIGATRARDMRDMAAVSLVIYVVAVLLLLPPFGMNGLWAALHVSLIARGATLWSRFPRLVASAGT